MVSGYLFRLSANLSRAVHFDEWLRCFVPVYPGLAQIPLDVFQLVCPRYVVLTQLERQQGMCDLHSFSPLRCRF